MATSQVLVSGANGFIGHHLCKKLVENKYNVVGISRSKKPANLDSLKDNQGFQIVQGDITNHHFLKELFSKFEIDAILHLAIAPPSHSPQTDEHKILDTQEYQTNFLATLNLLNTASKAGVKNWIQSSTMSVIDFNNPQYLPVDENHLTDPGEIYGFTKLLAENACKYYSKILDMNIIVLRYSGVYGIGKKQGLIAKFSHQCVDAAIDSFNASTNRTSDFIYVDDVVNANLLALEKQTINQNRNAPFFDLFNIGSGQEASVFETAKLIKELTNSDCKIVEEFSDNPRRFYFDCSKAIKQLNYHPNSLKDGLQKYISQLTENKNTAIAH
jgi:UDP-glucose 4-epimerase